MQKSGPCYSDKDEVQAFSPPFFSESATKESGVKQLFWWNFCTIQQSRVRDHAAWVLWTRNRPFSGRFLLHFLQFCVASAARQQDIKFLKVFLSPLIPPRVL